MKENVTNIETVETVENTEPAVLSKDDVFELRKPLKDGDKTITRLVFDFEKMNGREIIKADADLSMVLEPQEKAMIMVKESNFAYQLAIAARACGLTYDVMVRVNGPDAIKIARRAQSFLITGE